MGADLMKDVFKGIFKQGTPLQSLMQNIEEVDSEKLNRFSTVHNLFDIFKR